MNDLQAKDIFEWVEIAVAVEESMGVLETERCDEANDGLPDGPPVGAQGVIVPCSGLRERDVTGLEDLETA